MLPRRLAPTLLRLSRSFPIVAITGPRQSGKTTLARSVFTDKPYISLENPDELSFAQEDPKGFLARFPGGAIFDEAQRFPALFSWLQGVVDEDRRPGRFVLTGSQQFGLQAGISQSLAGRVGMTQLLPLSYSEWAKAAEDRDSAADLNAVMLKGGYPALLAQGVPGQDWFPSYVATYLERDVRQIIKVQDLGTFQRFIRLCAARTGQLLNLSGLAGEVGISENAARAWLSVLESSYLVYRLMPYHRNFGKRLVKTPKLYFLDVGLACWLMGIHTPQTLALHPQRGALFETWVLGECIKHKFNQGLPADLYFWRDNNGLESDILFESGGRIQCIEVKSGQTITTDYIKGGQKAGRIAGAEARTPWLIHGGSDAYERSGVRVIPWWGVDDALDTRNGVVG
jgi:predicted AAA+ superfamily ATPase